MPNEAKIGAPPHCPGVSNGRVLTEPVADQIMDFLDGKTDGEALLHALHDHVLDEPIPERMRALFRK